MPIDYGAARDLLERVFVEAEADLLRQSEPEIPPALQEPFAEIFASRTQAYREALLGCVIARLQDKAIDVRSPYANQGPTAYNGRTLDEQAVNPFLQRHRIPCSKGPFLSAFRRSVKFRRGTVVGLRDKTGYKQLLVLVNYLSATDNYDALVQFLRYLLYLFAKLRESSVVPLTRLQRISLEQYGVLIAGLRNS